MITQKELKEKLHYDPCTGIFTIIKCKFNVYIGKETGKCVDSKGYPVITLNKKKITSHRLAWLYVHGYLPEKGLDIDHIDRDKKNNRIENLRVVSRVCNLRNRGKQHNNKSGIIGVHWDNDRCKWFASISNHGKQYALGRFNTKRKAVQARWEAEKKYDFPNCNTTSTAYQYLTTT